MTEERLFKLQKAVMDLCVLLHTELSSMVSSTQQDNQDESFMSLGEVLGLDVHEALQHISEAVKDLLRLKRDLKLRNEYDGLHSDDQYQKALQKLEHEVRHHIKVSAMQIEQQLKLLVENTQAKLEDAERAKAELSSSHKATVDQLRKEYAKLLDSARPREPLMSARDLSSDRRDFKLSEELRQVKRNSQQDTSRISELERKIKRLETDRGQRGSATHSRRVSKENVADLVNTANLNDKRKYEDKYGDVSQLERKLKEQPNSSKETRLHKEATGQVGCKSTRRLSDPQVERLRKEKARPMSSTTLRQYVAKRAPGQ
jgi:hypothetical protein